MSYSYSLMASTQGGESFDVSWYLSQNRMRPQSKGSVRVWIPWFPLPGLPNLGESGLTYRLFCTWAIILKQKFAIVHLGLLINVNGVAILWESKLARKFARPLCLISGRAGTYVSSYWLFCGNSHALSYLPKSHLLEHSYHYPDSFF